MVIDEVIVQHFDARFVGAIPEMELLAIENRPDRDLQAHKNNKVVTTYIHVRIQKYVLS